MDSQTLLIDADNLPNNNYNESWEISGNIVITNIAKAKDIKINRLRKERETHFNTLDKLFIKYLFISRYY